MEALNWKGLSCILTMRCVFDIRSLGLHPLWQVESPPQVLYPIQCSIHAFSQEGCTNQQG